MHSRKASMTKTDLKNALIILDQIKLEVIAKGLPYTNARRIDDARDVVTLLISKGKK